jgi:site-specific recombinase XerD
MTLRSIRYLVEEYFGNVGVMGNKKTPHSLRHSAITNATRKGVTPMQVQAMAGHQSFDTLNYFHEISRLDNPAEDIISYE